MTISLIPHPLTNVKIMTPNYETTEEHNRDIDRLDNELSKKVDRSFFDAMIDPIKKTHWMVISTVLTGVVAALLTFFTQ